MATRRGDLKGSTLARAAASGMLAASSMSVGVGCAGRDASGRGADGAAMPEYPPPAASDHARVSRSDLMIASSAGKPERTPTGTAARPDLELQSGPCCAGKNDCKGKGSCKTAQNACKGQNPCKGQGGCKPVVCP